MSAWRGNAPSELAYVSQDHGVRTDSHKNGRWWSSTIESASGDRLRAARFLSLIGPVGAIVCAVWTLFYAWCGYPWPVVAGNIPVIVVGLTLPFASRRGINQKTLATFAAICLEIAVLIPIAYTGGIRSFNSAWLLVVPYIAVIGGVRNNWLYLMASAGISVTMLAALGATGNLPEAYVPFPVVQPFLSWMSAFAVMTFAIMLHHGFVESAIVQEKAVSTTLQEEVDHHRQTQADLAATQRDLITAARVAGMAEVANGVLHNVGNGLNTVNVGVAMLAKRVNPVPAERLTELATLMELPDTSLTAVTNYLRRVAEVAAEHHLSYQEDVARLRHQVEHVNTVVQAQQDYARHGGLVAEITVPELLNDTLLLVASRLQGISVNLDHAPDVILAADRHKTLRVLLNLINNAADAMQGVPSPTLHIAVHVERGHLVVRVADNGIGIPAENLQRIFGHGFTTKPNGHGFGLHSSALAAQELGGHLEVSSPGPGNGATFTFTVPLAPIRPQRAVDQESATPTFLGRSRTAPPQV